MEFWKAIGALLRRPHVGLSLIMAAVAFAMLVIFLVPLKYKSSAFLVLTTPAAGGTYIENPREPLGQSNPLLLFNDGLRTTATILIHSMNTQDAMRDLGVTPSESSTELVVDDGRSNPELLGSAGPFIYIEAQATVADDARAVVVRTRQRIRSELNARQKELGAPASTFITVVDVISPTAPTAVVSEKLETAAVALAAGLVVNFGVAYLVEGKLVRRRQRRRASMSAEEAYEFEREVRRSGSVGVVSSR